MNPATAAAYATWQDHARALAESRDEPADAFTFKEWCAESKQSIHAAKVELNRLLQQGQVRRCKKRVMQGSGWYRSGAYVWVGPSGRGPTPKTTRQSRSRK